MLRDFTEKDIGLASRLAIEEWGRYSGLPQDVLEIIADYGVKCWLDKATYIRVFEIDGEGVGLLFGNIEGDEILFPDLERADLDSMPRESSKELVLEVDTNRELLESCKDKEYDCSLVYFIASSGFRGKGIGSELINDFMEYAKSRGKRRMFLYTDDFSNYPFYERRGFVRDACKTIFIDGGDHEYYIYSKEL